MKRLAFSFLLALGWGAAVFAQSAAELAENPEGGAASAAEGADSLAVLAGVWENPSRFVAISGGDDLSFVLKTFYGFYYDQAATLDAQLEYAENGETVMRIKYPSTRQMQAHPFGVISDKLFLDFYCRGSAFASATTPALDDGAPLLGYWRECGNVSGIEIQLPRYKSELTCYYFTEKDAYLLRYWLADVEYDSVLATATDGDFSFEVDKFLKVGDLVYTCVTGRGTNIRYYEKLGYTLEGDKITFSNAPEKTLPVYLSADGDLLSFVEPYLTRSSITDIDAVISEHNSHTHNPLKNPLEVFERKTVWEELLERM